jgi:hypothetical protein
MSQYIIKASLRGKLAQLIRIRLCSYATIQLILRLSYKQFVYIYLRTFPNFVRVDYSYVALVWEA